MTFRLHLPSAGNARSLGQTAPSFQHQQAGAEEEPTSGSRCPQMVRRIFQRTQRIQIHDDHDAAKEYRYGIQPL